MCTRSLLIRFRHSLKHHIGVFLLRARLPTDPSSRNVIYVVEGHAGLRSAGNNGPRTREHWFRIPQGRLSVWRRTIESDEHLRCCSETIPRFGAGLTTNTFSFQRFPVVWSV